MNTAVAVGAATVVVGAALTLTISPWPRPRRGAAGESVPDGAN